MNGTRTSATAGVNLESALCRRGDTEGGANRLFLDRAPTTTTLARLLTSSPDVSPRDGNRALAPAMTVHEAQPTAVHGKTVVVELGRCAEAASWIQKAVAAAQRDSDGEGVARLRKALPCYERMPLSTVTADRVERSGCRFDDQNRLD